jgi:envelope integrity protein B
MRRIADLFPVVAGLALLFGPQAAAAADNAEVALAPHRAIYDLKLAEARGRRQLSAVQGRIVYDFSGSSCEGYALQFRQVTQLDNGEGKVVVSDLRSATWEEGEAKNYRFNFQNYLSERLVDSVDGRAERKPQAVAINLAQPEQKQFNVDAAVVFPTEHIRRIVTAARAGQTVLELPVYDGSETGEKLYNTLTVIGRAIPPGERKPDDAVADKPGFDKLTRWPVTISYFDRAKEGAAGEQTPVYSIRFELYENGVSRALLLDYGDFSIRGTMTELDMREAHPCQ